MLSIITRGEKEEIILEYQGDITWKGIFDAGFRPKLS